MAAADDRRFARLAAELDAVANPVVVDDAWVLAVRTAAQFPIGTDRGEPFDPPLTSQQERVRRVIERVWLASARASGRLAAAWADPVALVCERFGHRVSFRKRRGGIVIDDAWRVALDAEGSDLFDSSPAPYMIGEARRLFWIVDLDRHRFARLDAATPHARGFRFLPTLQCDALGLTYELPELVLEPSVHVVTRIRRVAFCEIPWLPCTPVVNAR
jgi:hypothetical protein